ncbi:hypothetical protein [Hymenobacter psoromatis]|nr:hypothetical protein [Hymenobacter psoromatis]
MSSPLGQLRRRPAQAQTNHSLGNGRAGASAWHRAVLAAAWCQA